jgi:hypothetical protein
MRGSSVKLCRGGGQEVAQRVPEAPRVVDRDHAAVEVALEHAFHRNGSVDTPRMKAPIEEIVFSTVNPSVSR